MFNDPRNGNLADGQIRLWYKLKEDRDAPKMAAMQALPSD